MAQGKIAELARRGVVAVSGPDAQTFLNDLVTSDVPAAGGAAYGALLSPQGKILFDFVAFNDGARFLFDLPRASAAEFARRLGFYRLRAKVEVADLSGERNVLAAWDSETAPRVDGPAVRDPRLPALGWRAIVPAGADMAPDYEEASEADYDAHRIALGIPEGGIDFAYGDTFPHDADMDQLGGVDFRKGCYVGQEVVSRMEHRGTARRRFVQVSGLTSLPPASTAISAAGRPIGAMGSSSGAAGIAEIRLDRAKEALDGGVPLSADGVALSLAIPPWARFGWPATVTADD